MSEIINFTRLTTSDRISDRFLTCQVYSPVDLEQAQAGTIFSQIEILNPWFPTSQIGQTVINTLIREYYRGGDTSDLVNFENAIKKVNEALAQIAQGGETDWIGKFNGVLTLVREKEIHLAQTGISEAYLYRGGKISHITEGLRGDEAPHPLKTFTNLTSGTLQKDDRIVIASPDFFKAISAEELGTLVTSFRPTTAAIESAKILKSKDTQSGNAIFMELTTKEELSSVPPDQKLDVVYINEAMFSLSGALRDSWNRAIVPAALWLARSSAAALGKSREALAPKIKMGLKEAKKKAGRVTQLAMSKTQKAGEKLSRATAKKSTRGTAVARRGGEGALLDAPKKFLLKTKNKLKRFLIGANLYSRKKSKMVLVLAGLAVLLLILTLTFSLSARSKKIGQENFEGKLAAISSLETDASLAKSQGKDEEAVTLYRQIIALAKEVEAAEAEEKATQEIKEICQIKDAEAGELEVAEPIKLMARVGESVYGISSSGKVYVSEEPASAFSYFGELDTKSEALEFAWGVEDAGKLALLSNKSSILTFDLRQKKLKEEPVEFAGIGPLDSFGENLYFLDSSSGQITRINFIGGSYSTAVPYLKDNERMPDAIDLAIDGTVYTLSQNGKITRFSRGRASGEFELTLPANEKLTGYQTISTSVGADTILIFERNTSRIIEISKAGNFLGQFDLPKLPEDSKILIDPVGRSVLAAKDDKVLFYSLPQKTAL